MSLKWDQRFLRLALEIASWSKDESTKVGSVVVGPKREIRSTGYNGIPRGVDDDVAARHERPLKYSFFGSVIQSTSLTRGSSVASITVSARSSGLGLRKRPVRGWLTPSGALLWFGSLAEASSIVGPCCGSRRCILIREK